MKTKSFIMACALSVSAFAVQFRAAGAELAPDKEGFIRDWLVLAPIQLDSEADGAKEIEKSQVPDEGMLKPKAGDKVTVAGKALTWKKVKATDYYLDLNAIVNAQTENTVGYAVCYIRADEERKDLDLKMGSNDEGKVYLNGKLLLKTTEPRPLERDNDAAHKITLNKGVNTLVFKVFNEGGSDWQGCIRFTDSKGKPVTDLVIQLEP